MSQLEIRIGPARFANPVFTASGTLGYGTELLGSLPLHRLGGVVSKGLTLTPREGNPPPRVVETPCGMINSIGLENPGIRTYVLDVLPVLREAGVEVILNVEGRTPEEFEALVDLADEAPVQAVEVNVSCPNVESGLLFGQDPRALERLVARLRRRTKKSLWVKLTPNFVDIREEARAAEEGGADAVVIANTYLATAVDVERRAFRLARGFGGLSGPAVHPMTLYLVWRAYQAVSIPIIAVGGIVDVHTALAYWIVGATAVQVGSALFQDPWLPFRILDALPDYLERHGMNTIRDLVGSVQFPDEVASAEPGSPSTPQEAGDPVQRFQNGGGDQNLV